jgi:tetratricopeptide (TPR) repeat protein
VRGAVLVVVLALSAMVGVAHADHAGEMKARESFAAGRFDEALELFAKLYAETLNPIYLRNIGRCHQKLREPQKAIDAFHDYLAKGKKIGPDERAEIDGYIKEMEALRDEQAKQAAPPPAPVQPIAAPQPAGPPPGYGAPGPGYAAPPPAGYGAQPPAGSLVAEAGQPPPAQSSPIYERWWFWTAIGVVVAGGVVAALLIPGGTTKPPCPSGVTCQ